jgi:dienelactone hydrolase
MLLNVSSAVAQSEALLTPTGSLGVGRIVLHWQDDSRPEVLSSRATDKRELGVWFWYPAKDVAEKQKAPYIDQLDTLAASLSSDEVSLARSVPTHAVVNAIPVSSPPRLPVLVFSPGSGSLPALYTSFMEELASHGYVVVALDHPFDDIAVRLADGRIVKEATQPSDGQELMEYQRERVTVRSDDVRFVLDQLNRMQRGELKTLFEGRLDLERIGVFGHSTGGMTAAEVCMRNRRVKACANLDGVVNAQPAYVDNQGRGPNQPFLFIEKPLPLNQGERPEEARQQLNLLRQRGDAVLSSSIQEGRSYRITIEGARHSTFSDEDIIADTNAAAPRHLLDLARTYLLAFFDEVLTKKENAILSVPKDAAIQIESFSPSVNTRRQ